MHFLQKIVRTPNKTSRDTTRFRKRGEVIGNYINKKLQLKIWLNHNVVVYRKKLICNICASKDVNELNIDSLVALNPNVHSSAIIEFLDYASRNTCEKSNTMNGISWSTISCDRCYTLCGISKKQIIQVIIF